MTCINFLLSVSSLNQTIKVEGTRKWFPIKLLIVTQILPDGTRANMRRTLWRICVLLRCKWLILTELGPRPLVRNLRQFNYQKCKNLRNECQQTCVRFVQSLPLVDSVFRCYPKTRSPNQTKNQEYTQPSPSTLQDSEELVSENKNNINFYFFPCRPLVNDHTKQHASLTVQGKLS